MALLTISEPGGKPAKPAHRPAVGIDLGTTNSLVATKCGATVEVLAGAPRLQESVIVPSIVHYSADAEPTVGAAAKHKAIEDPANTVVSVKRMLGKSLLEIKSQYPHLPYRFDESRPADSSGKQTPSPTLHTAAGPKTPVEVSADILRFLKARAETNLGGPVEGAVVTVPAYFNDGQRQQTLHAAEQAGLPVLRLLNEPTAAAVAYGLDSGDEGVLAVFDLGGGTFDVSLLRLSRGVFEVLATGGDTNLGGDDFDQAIVDWALQQHDPGEMSRQEQARLRTLATAAKHRLSTEPETPLEWHDLTLTEAVFAEIVKELVSRTLLACRRVLRDAGLKPQEVDNIIMVGGATRMPVLRKAVAALFGKEPLTAIDPDQVVAVGAAIQADVLVGNKSDTDFLLLDVTPLSLGIETMGELVEKIIPRNTTIPAAQAQEFTTFKDGQTAMSLHVVQGERELVSDCRSLARFDLRDIPPMTAGAAKIRVTFQVDADGLLSVSAEETGTGSKAEVQVKPSYGLDADTIERMLESSHDHAEADKELRALKEAEVDARRLITALQAAQSTDGDLMSEAEHARMDAAVADLTQAIEDADARAIRAGTEHLNEVSAEFAGRRMNLHVNRALKGRSIEDEENAETHRNAP